MPTKTPIYLKSGSKKGVSNSKNGKKLRELLSSEMISLPLGDFRHTAHVGKGADDVFGDTTFLKLQSNSDLSKKENLKELASLRGSLRENGFRKDNKLRTASENKILSRPLSDQSYDGYGSTSTDSPILQSAFSLPLLNQSVAMSIPVSSNNSKEAKDRKAKKGFTAKLAQSKTKSHDTGLNCLSAAPQDHAYQRQASEVSSTDNSDHSAEKLSESEQSSSTTLTDKPIASSLKNGDDLCPTSPDEAWTFDLDLGSSLLDEVMSVLHKSDEGK